MRRACRFRRLAERIVSKSIEVLKFEESSTRLLGEALTDEGGEALISLRTDVLFPVAAAITVWDGTTPVVQAKIPRKAVSRLYPGEVCALDLRHKGTAKP